MDCEFTYTTNAFQDESWDLSNFICYEGSRIIDNEYMISLFKRLKNNVRKVDNTKQSHLLQMKLLQDEDKWRLQYL